MFCSHTGSKAQGWVGNTCVSRGRNVLERWLDCKAGQELRGWTWGESQTPGLSLLLNRQGTWTKSLFFKLHFSRGVFFFLKTTFYSILFHWWNRFLAEKEEGRTLRLPALLVPSLLDAQTSEHRVQLDPALAPAPSSLSSWTFLFCFFF